MHSLVYSQKHSQFIILLFSLIKNGHNYILLCSQFLDDVHHGKTLNIDLQFMAHLEFAVRIAP